MASLAGSTQDVIATITSYLDGSYVTRLLLCGNVQLSATIRLACQEMTLETRPLQNFPFSVFDLPQLRSLSLLPIEYCGVYPLGLKEALPVPANPLNSLRTLNLGFSRSLSILRLVDGVPLLDMKFPNLTSLSLTDGFVELNAEHMEAVPKGLEHLHLSTRSLPAVRPSLQASVLNKLPARLTSLHFYTGSILADPDTKDYSTVVWPPGLTSLFLRSVDSTFFTKIPTTLEKLSLSIFEPSQVASVVPTDVFPAGLTQLAVMNFGQSSLLFRPGRFPPGLTRCTLQFDYSSPNPSDWSQLPKSITSCTLSVEFHKIGSIAAFLPKLTQLNGYYGSQSYPEAFCRDLPPKLKEIQCARLFLGNFPTIPESVVDMVVRVLPVQCTSHCFSPDIPPHEGFASKLPRHLTNLNLHNASLNNDTRSLFCRVDFELLPRTLRLLSFDLIDIQDRETFLGLPTSLEDIAIYVTDCSLCLEAELLDTLPSGLSRISLRIDATDRTEWVQWMKRSGRFCGLTSLTVAVADFVPKADPTQFDFLPSLPNTITDLELSLDRTRITPEQFKQLPPRLSRFSLYSLNHPEAVSFATDECFANLPKSLYKLSIARDLQGLTTNLFQILPSKLASLRVPKNIATSIREYTKREPDWGDCVPE